jgi:hypothetical protein
MPSKLTALAVLAIAAITLTAAAAASPSSAKQRVAISVKGGAASFVLTPLTPGALQNDSGTATFCCWTERHVVRAGEDITINNPQMTLTGKRGTLVARNRIEWADIPDGWEVFTGTWKVVSGTGDYASLSGGGLVAGAASPADYNRSRFMGLLGAK